jgi:thiamine-monophosphate kinase
VPLGEFSLIDRYFSRPSRRRDVLLGVGDDAALLQVPAGQALVAATDTLVEGRHFLPGAPPRSIGHQALAVNLSDLAAMGADAAWALLSLSLPKPDEDWLQGFADGLYALADSCGVDLVGGDTVRGPLVVTIEALGCVDPALALRRSGARPGDRLYVSGWPGEARQRLDSTRSRAARRSMPPATRWCGVTCMPSRGSSWATRCAVAPAPRWTSPMACSATCASCVPRAAWQRG